MLHPAPQTTTIQPKPQTAIAQTTQPAENPFSILIERYPTSFEWWVWLFLIIQLLKAIADLRNGDDD